MNSDQLESRLIDFAVMIISLTRLLEKKYAGRQLSNQITRASISSALNYVEARHAESKKYFFHKIKVLVKELKEVQIGLRICFRTSFLKSPDHDSIL